MFRFNGNSRRHRLFGITLRQAYQYYTTNINDTMFRKSLARYYSSIYNTSVVKSVFRTPRLLSFGEQSSLGICTFMWSELDCGYPIALSTYWISFLAYTWFILLFFYWLDIPIEDLSYFGVFTLFFAKFDSRLTVLVVGVSGYKIWTTVFTLILILRLSTIFKALVAVQVRKI